MRYDLNGHQLFQDLGEVGQIRYRPVIVQDVAIQSMLLESWCDDGSLLRVWEVTCDQGRVTEEMEERQDVAKKFLEEEGWNWIQLTRLGGWHTDDSFQHPYRTRLQVGEAERHVVEQRWWATQCLRANFPDLRFQEVEISFRRERREWGGWLVLPTQQGWHVAPQLLRVPRIIRNSIFPELTLLLLVWRRISRR